MHHLALDENFPDPSILTTQEGYWAYATETQGGVNVPVAYSKDLVHWELRGDAMPEKPDWVSHRRFLWAPHVFCHEGVYVMFFSGQVGEGKHWPTFGIGAAFSERPEGPFVATRTPAFIGKDFQDIDPMVFQDPVTEKYLLYYGSGWHSLRVREMTWDLVPNISARDVLWPSERKYEHLIEAAWVVYRNGWYFLFYSGDSATHPPHYAVLVARSRSPFGPFEKKEAPLIEEDDYYAAPGHCAVATDPDGRDQIFYHGIDRLNYYVENTRDEVRRVLLRQTLAYGEWPELVEEREAVI